MCRYRLPGMVAALAREAAGTPAEPRPGSDDTASGRATTSVAGPDDADLARPPR
ncbi:hypothetical protein [Saccharothrix australiensis]|uniref:Uncharacterized protein n=1 Tax=Saccharothrix australiensis TaxID=2072 RepID=A0A495VYK2_9PSEU|nr:hypothetical protein [Saccharothrix australiensis]RKT54284.1 hypothetical protein C8E97_2900 [Saccharothrix australiensis]